MFVNSIALLALSVLSQVTGTSADVAKGYWDIGDKGFLPMNKGGSCMNTHMKHFCNILQTNPTTEEIDKAAESISISDLFIDNDSIYPESVIEDTFHWFSVGLCRIGRNQNPSGDKTNIPIMVPQSFSYKLTFLSHFLQREPTTSYASLVLDNCVHKKRRGDDGNSGNSGTSTYDDWKIQRTVTIPSEELAHRAEKGFYASHCSVELSFADAIKSLKKMEEILKMDIGGVDHNTKINELTMNLREMAYNVRKAIPVLKQMRHYFNSEHFFTYLRPFLKCGNIGENGIVFEGEENLMANIHLPNNTMREIEFNKVLFGFRGPTGAQTTSLSTIDAGLQITTSISADKNLETTMKEFRQYHPMAHYVFNNRVSKMSIRDYILSVSDDTDGITELTDAYNDAVTAVAEWRYAHVDHVMTYIFKSIPHVPKNAVTGTGNTPISLYLCKSALGTLKSRIYTDGIGSKNLPTISIPFVCSEECSAGNGRDSCSDYCEDITKVNK